jgi:hypothetical protein
VSPGGFATAVRSISDLRGYWTLGDGAEPFLDTSGYDPGDPGDLSIAAGTEPMSEDVTGALLVGDDGAVSFNLQANSTGAGLAEFLVSPGGGFDNDRWKPHATTGEIALACFLYIGNNPNGHEASAFAVGAGMWIGVDYPARTIFWYPESGTTVKLVSPAMVVNTWVLVVAQYDGTNAELYVNNVLVDTEAMAAVGDASSGQVNIGASILPTSRGYYYGRVDEAALWAKALTPDERGSLWTLSGVPSFGQVLGSGGTYVYPVKTWINGA